MEYWCTGDEEFHEKLVHYIIITFVVQNKYRELKNLIITSNNWFQ